MEAPLLDLFLNKTDFIKHDGIRPAARNRDIGSFTIKGIRNLIHLGRPETNESSEWVAYNQRL